MQLKCRIYIRRKTEDNSKKNKRAHTHGERELHGNGATRNETKHNRVSENRNFFKKKMAKLKEYTKRNSQTEAKNSIHSHKIYYMTYKNAESRHRHRHRYWHHPLTRCSFEEEEKHCKPIRIETH